ncbi:MAG: 50S ribosomal protein L24 [Nanoarchaeota archaeon]|nr:50S ribosomal protein L24 [Nanoarchaeota archaeon]MBU1644480.1 50S ribosomal protein L24 [Nanoarchaeota archaeon]MBU1976484.1 50S ribosomal protein L24 [Nanoarchaeota archaeon]
MVKTGFSTGWNKSVQPRRQRKYRYNAPLHVRQKLAHVHLSKDLRQKHGLRNLQVKTGDKVKVLRGKFKGKEGKVERVNLKRERVFVTGLDHIKKDGSKVPAGFNPSNLMIVVLDTTDKRRKINKKGKKESKTEVKEEVKKEESKESKSETKKEKSNSEDNKK